MRHGDKQNNLGRKKAHRDALLSNLAAQLITHKRIVTTLAKAKELRKYVEPMITKTKKNESEAQISHNHRLVFSFLQNKLAVKELFTVVGPKINARPGGYTRIIKLGIRPGDNAEKAMIELVDFNEIYGKGIASDQEPAKKTRRSRATTTKKVDSPVETIAHANAITEAEVVEEKSSKDDLTKVEGIGPKAAETLNAAGITTFAELAAKSADEIKAILDASEGQFNAVVTTTWAHQAQLAADGKWDELNTLQDELKGGKEA
ncbi:50S ribosomal protein L17 [Arachidicoccus sp.]|uniref:50S ribosomal protein L17 n=1 Tax=Arachidicoccus sp. TaxID=1872624 RepID=UPI003D1E294E